MKLKRILVAVDFSPHSRKAMEGALSLAENLGSSILILHVWEPPHYVAPDLMLTVPGWSALSLEQYAKSEAEKAMEKFVGGLDLRGLDVKKRIETGSPAAAIVRAASEEADLIVIGTHGFTGINRLLLGSVAQEVVAKAPCPVLTIKLI